MPDPLPIEQFIAQQLASGRYQNYDELVEEALRLLQAREAEDDRIADRLKPAVEEFLSGHPGLPFDADDIIQRGQERLAADQRHV